MCNLTSKSKTDSFLVERYEVSFIGGSLLVFKRGNKSRSTIWYTLKYWWSGLRPSGTQAPPDWDGYRRVDLFVLLAPLRRLAYVDFHLYSGQGRTTKGSRIVGNSVCRQHFLYTHTHTHLYLLSRSHLLFVLITPPKLLGYLLPSNNCHGKIGKHSNL